MTGKVVFPKDTITLIVKCTFDLKQNAPVEAAPDGEQLLPTGDLYHGDDPRSSVRYESDFAYFKPDDPKKSDVPCIENFTAAASEEGTGDLDMSGAYFTGISLKNENFKGVNLEEANLAQADFTLAFLKDCNFSNCHCDFVNFSRAELVRATFGGAVGRQINFRRAVLDGARAGQGVQMPESVFRPAKGHRANWSGADLRNYDFIPADMQASDFSGSNLTGCDCRTAELKQSVFDGACLSQGQFNRTNIFARGRDYNDNCPLQGTYGVERVPHNVCIGGRQADKLRTHD